MSMSVIAILQQLTAEAYHIKSTFCLTAIFTQLILRDQRWARHC